MTRPKVELKPCPFCGNSVHYVKATNDPAGQPTYAVSCQICGASGPRCKSKAKAKRHWNYWG